MRATLLLLLLFSVGVLAQTAQSGDLDHDGIADALEQQLLERFQPQVRLSVKECDSRPASFQAGQPDPVAVARDGTLYGQVSPVTWLPGAGRSVEVHYFHLWAKDCGQRGHHLDAEHVSALVHAETADAPVEQWTARYWYSAAHQETVCDASHGARASTLEAVTHGPAVWISRGKHASFLAEELCAWGCGSDRCGTTLPLVVPRIVNLGEPTAPMPAAPWVRSEQWPLAARMGADFTVETLARLDRAKPDEIVAINDANTPLKSFILGTGAAASGLATGRDETGSAFGRAIGAIGRALKTATQPVAED